MNSEREGNRGGNIEKGESEIKEEERERLGWRGRMRGRQSGRRDLGAKDGN